MGTAAGGRKRMAGRYHRHCERSEAIHNRSESVDCFVASLLAMTVGIHLRPVAAVPMSCGATTGGRTIMADSGSGNTDNAWRSGAADFQPHAFDPWLQPELFRGVLTRRALRS